MTLPRRQLGSVGPGKPGFTPPSPVMPAGRTRRSTVSPTILRSSREAPVLDVPEVQLDPLGPARELRPLTCAQPVMPGRTDEPPALPLGVVHDLLRQRRPRPDQAHVAAQDVPQLRQLVEAGRPQQSGPADASGRRPAPPGRLGPHRAQLDDRELAAVPAGAPLAEQHRPAQPPPHQPRPPPRAGAIRRSLRPGLHDHDRPDPLTHRPPSEAAPTATAST